MPASDLRRVAGDLLAQVQRRVARTLRMILVGDRRAEQRHDAVARELVDETLEALDALGENREEALHDRAPLFRVELLGEVHRALHVGEQHRHLLVLAFEGGLRLQDPVGEVLWCMGAGLDLRRAR